MITPTTLGVIANITNAQGWDELRFPDDWLDPIEMSQYSESTREKVALHRFLLNVKDEFDRKDRALASCDDTMRRVRELV